VKWARHVSRIRDKKFYQNFGRRLGRMENPKGKWEDDAEMYLEDIEYEAG
jgi:hypothetical protein